ncbi:glyceraldehyde-3-phosphate dehydrogenase [Vibrio sp. 10N.286.49.B3]|uniref:BamA/TamA family outer membrane protein n=1 Tax=Vibrio sp. 10N.286.49.B3 TaxID=1880855 RepID=UPI000C822525|nr:BamA/TamA family outer membrane protein [Vibrio sp. 10N.286.49.B3]PMH43753.1 glyceraldehyde-3-phosphate dehydrogenase [Vibrio sp. 10N.286.49.B3]
MHKYTLSHLSLLLTSVLALPAAASFFDPIDNQFDLGEHLAENAYGFLPIPILITEPAVGVGGGVVGLFLHESEEEKNARKELAMHSLDGGAQLMPAAITLVGAAGTENGTWFAFAGHRHSWLKDSIRYTGGLGAGEANLDIYQDISLIETPLKFQTNTSGAVLFQHLQFRIADMPLMLGVKQILAQSSVGSDNKYIDKVLTLLLGEDSITSGLGITADYDTRNNLFFPTNGYAITAEYMIYDEKIGSDWNYHNLNINGEGYIPLNDKWTLALAGNYQLFNSDQFILPPTVQPYVDLRGVASYRYQGDEIQTIQSQIMYAIDNRWTVSAFYGIGRAIEDKKFAQDNDESVDAYGVGFRYQIARRYGIHMGVDVAFSDDDSAFYITVGSGL